jgi:LysM repeat protein
MAVTGNVSHTGAGGSTVTQRLLSLGYPLAGDLSLGGFRSENITSGNEEMSAQEAVNRWTGDAPHLTTMISPDLTEIGAGVTVLDGRVYYVIDCARPTDSGIPQGVDPSAPGASPAAGPTLPPGVSGIMIPVVVVTPNAAGDVIHEVKAGQTLWQIAISYETKIDEIKRLNNLFDNEIYPGTRLLVKKGVFLATTVPVETPIPETGAAATILPATQAAQTPTRVTAPAAMPVTSGTRNTLQIAVGIIALAVLGGGVVAWWGSRKK